MARELVPPERFLEWGVEDGWEPLCWFLGREVPITSFPNGNTPAASLKVLDDSHGRWKRDAYRNMGLVAEIVIAGVALLASRERVRPWRSGVRRKLDCSRVDLVE